MRRFSDFAEESSILDGEKTTIENILNKEVVVLGYAVRDSQYSKNRSGKYLTLQVEVEQQRRVLFTGSDVLIEQMQKYCDMIPFATTIKRVDKFFTMS